MSSTLHVRGESTGPSPAVSPSAAPSEPRASTLEELRRRTVHTVVGPSGGVYRLKIPDLAFMLSHGEIPEQLRHVAMLEVLNDDERPLAAQTKEDGSPLLDIELVRDFYDLRATILVAAIVEPVLTVDDLALIPTEDKDMLQGIATRQRVTDARGVVLGVEQLERWATFRGEHGCPADCPHCSEALRKLSTLDVD